MFFQLFSTIKVRLVDEMMQSAFLRVIFHVKHKKINYHLSWFLTWFLILVKIQDSGQDDDHCWWRHRPPAASSPTKYTSSCWEGQRLSTDGKIVSKYCNISKTLGRGSINPPFPCTTVGLWICAYVRGLNTPNAKMAVRLIFFCLNLNKPN